MTRIEPIEWTEKTALRERDQLRTAINELIASINGTAGDADAAAASALKAEQEANRSAEFAHAAQTAADTAIGKADEAIATANGASAVANGIDGKATQALQQSAAAVATANGIDAKAQNALDTAGDAMTEASDASAKAFANGKAINASNGRIGTLEQSQGQQDAKIANSVQLTGTQSISGNKSFTGKVTVPTADYSEPERAVNVGMMRGDPSLMKTTGEQRVDTTLINYGEYVNKADNVDINDQFYRETPATKYTDMNDKIMARTVSWITDGGIGSSVETVNARIDKKVGLDTTVFDDGTSQLIFIRSDGTRVTVVPRG